MSITAPPPRNLHLPSTAVIDFGRIDTDLNCPEEERDRGRRIFAVHFVASVIEEYIIDHWMNLRRMAPRDEAPPEQMDALFNFSFADDGEILEAVQEEKSVRSVDRSELPSTTDQTYVANAFAIQSRQKR
ncbi:hypothetical protein [Thalassovita sp.]|uniref:hypothetical protein n=1 Tax=Thalassovita sp. TaxID=1979401 RepID=UPI002B265D8F|nr:hypothetical protein [Thalassovita sp.]